MSPQARAQRYYAENKEGSSWMDVVCVETDEGGFEMSYDAFRNFFDLEIPKGREIAFEVSAKQVKEKNCKLPR